ncbi:hypothetical protein CDD83_8867 [Cordyceps sp. RAO-2017]|nr:hypothetical protein CDD83_8867 [Cordyceps sp. RAO-2017]
MKSRALLAVLFASGVSCQCGEEKAPTMIRAVSVLRGDTKVSGTVVFEQESESAPTKITWNITGNDPKAQRGFHIHAYGDHSDGCASAGPHFNPFNKKHGAPSDEERHVGDMGNIETDEQGVAQGTLTDSQIKLVGPDSVIGRSVVVHAGTDDLGKGNHEESPLTGNAGGRPACGSFCHLKPHLAVEGWTFNMANVHRTRERDWDCE